MLGLVEIDLARRIKPKGFAATGVLKHLFGLAIPRGVRASGRRDDTSATGVASHTVHGSGGKADIVVKPARLPHDVRARPTLELLPRLNRRHIDERAAWLVKFSGLVGCIFGRCFLGTARPRAIPAAF